MASKPVIPLDKLIELDENRYKKAKAAIERVRQIAESEDYDEFKNTGLKLAALGLAEVLNGEVRIVGEEVDPEKIIEEKSIDEDEMI
jgi:DNA-directed RNA polymerase subunit K/omega